MTAKPISIKDAKRKSGGRASKTVELTSGDPPRVPMAPMPVGTEPSARPVDRAAEVSSGRSSPKNAANRQGRFPARVDRAAARIKAQTVCNRQVIEVQADGRKATESAERVWR